MPKRMSKSHRRRGDGGISEFWAPMMPGILTGIFFLIMLFGTGSGTLTFIDQTLYGALFWGSGLTTLALILVAIMLVRHQDGYSGAVLFLTGAIPLVFGLMFVLGQMFGLIVAADVWFWTALTIVIAGLILIVIGAFMRFWREGAGASFRR